MVLTGARPEGRPGAVGRVHPDTRTTELLCRWTRLAVGVVGRRAHAKRRRSLLGVLYHRQFTMFKLLQLNSTSEWRGYDRRGRPGQELRRRRDPDSRTDDLPGSAGRPPHSGLRATEELLSRDQVQGSDQTAGRVGFTSLCCEVSTLRYVDIPNSFMTTCWQ